MRLEWSSCFQFWILNEYHCIDIESLNQSINTIQSENTSTPFKPFERRYYYPFLHLNHVTNRSVCVDCQMITILSRDSIVLLFVFMLCHLQVNEKITQFFFFSFRSILLVQPINWPVVCVYVSFILCVSCYRSGIEANQLKGQMSSCARNWV